MIFLIFLLWTWLTWFNRKESISSVLDFLFGFLGSKSSLWNYSSTGLNNTFVDCLMWSVEVLTYRPILYWKWNWTQKYCHSWVSSHCVLSHKFDNSWLGTIHWGAIFLFMVHCYPVSIFHRPKIVENVQNVKDGASESTIWF